MIQCKRIQILVPDDQHSARRLLDDADILSTLERCFRLIHEPYKSSLSLDLPANSVPGSASSLRISVTSYLARFLKRSIFDKIKHRQTRLDHNLFDVIWPAMKKATKERKYDEDLNAGVVAPDFDVYVVFQEFLVPLIKDIHNMDTNHDFIPHPKTSYFPENLEDNTPLVSEDLTLNLDPSNKFLIAGTVECSRNLDEYELPLNLTVSDLEKVERVVTGQLLTIGFSKCIGENELGMYYTINEVLEKNSEIRTVLAANGLLIPLLDTSDENQAAESSAINGQFWPFGRGVFVNQSNDLAIWINVQEHVRLLSVSTSDAPGDLGYPYAKIGKVLRYLEEHIDFRFSYLLGNLSSRPSYLGTSLRLTYSMDIPHLSKEIDNLRHLCIVRGLHMKTSIHEPDIIRISNMQSLGITEWKIFQEFSTAVANILQLEKDISMTNTKHIAAMLVKIFRKKKNSLIEA